MSKQIIFREDFTDFYLRLDETQKAHFLEFADKHAPRQLNDCLNEIDDLQVVK